MGDEQREEARTALETAVWEAIDAGVSSDDIRETVEGCIEESMEDVGETHEPDE